MQHDRLLLIGLVFFRSVLAQPGVEVRLVAQTGAGSDLHRIAVSSDGRYAATGGNFVTVWDLETRSEVYRFNQGGRSEIAFSPNGAYLMTGSDTARLWDLTNGRKVHSFEADYNRYYVFSLAFSPDSRQVLVGSGEGTARLWDVTTGKEVQRFTGHAKAVTSVAFSGDGRLVATGSNDTTVCLWDPSTGREVRRFGGPEAIYSLAFSPDGHRLLVGGEAASGAARLWDIETGVEIRRFEGMYGALSPDGRYVLTESYLSGGRLWDVETGKEVRAFENRKDDIAVSVVFSADGRYVIRGFFEGTLGLFDVSTGKEIASFGGSSKYVSSIALSPDGNRLLIGSWDKTTHLWDIQRGTELLRLQGHSDAVTSVAFSPDGRNVLTASRDHTVRNYDATTGKELGRISGLNETVVSAAWSPDGRYSVLGITDGTTRILSLSTGKELRVFKGHGQGDGRAGPVFSPDGQYVLAGDDRARLFNVATGTEARSFPHPRGVLKVAFSPDGRQLLTAGFDGTARLWDVSTGEELRQFVGHTDYINALAVSPDGREVLTGSHDRTARVWDIASGREIHRLEGHFGDVDAVAYSPDGRHLLTGSWDGTVRLWRADTGGLQAVLVPFVDSAWAVIDPDGRYDASDPDRSVGLHWVAGAEVIELRQLKQRFYTPGLLARIWREERLPDIDGSLREIVLPPDVVLTDPDQTTLRVQLTNRGGGLGAIVVKVNGRELATGIRGSLDPQSATANLAVDLATAVLRPDGINAIEVFAFDAKGLVASRQVNRVWKTPPRKDVSPPSLYALVAGVSAYSGAESMNLQWAAKDAADIANALRLGANRLFGAERLHITLLTSASSQESGRPTKKNILRHFQEIAQQAQPADAVVLYLAGHGTAYGRDRYYYLTQDARGLDLSDETLRDVSTLSSEEISRWLQMEVKALKQVIILDTCAAGAATSELVKLAEKRDLSPDQIRAIELLKDATGSHVLMGSAADKVSYEASRYGQGLLTYALLAGMKGEVPLDGENLDVLKWFSYAQLRVEGLARGIGGIQKPVLSSPRGSSFPIAMLNEEEKRAIPLARAKPQLLRVLCLDENDGAVGLTPQLRARLRQLSYSSASGSPQVEPALVYLDNVLDDLPGAILPRVRYRRSRDGLKVTLRLFRDNVALHQHELNLPKDAEEAASRLAMYLQSILVKLKN